MKFDAPMDKILYGIRHHAKSLRVVGEELILQLVAQKVQGEWFSRRGGANSNVIRLSPGRLRYLYGNKATGEIEVRRRPNGPAVHRLKWRHDVRKWVEAGCPL